jgi:hypothetical protein
MWAEFDHAIEILATHVIPSKSWHHECKKAMMIKDLLIKVFDALHRIPQAELMTLQARSTRPTIRTSL